MYLIVQCPTHTHLPVCTKGGEVWISPNGGVDVIGYNWDGFEGFVNQNMDSLLQTAGRLEVAKELREEQAAADELRRAARQQHGGAATAVMAGIRERIEARELQADGADPATPARPAAPQLQQVQRVHHLVQNPLL